MKKTQKNKGISAKPHYWDEACDYLSQQDAVMAAIIKAYKGEAPLRKANAFHTLARSIVGQQISVKAADSIWFRLEKLLKGKLKPELVLRLKDKQLRAIGFSESKVNYLKNVANFFVKEMKGEIDLIDADHVEIAGKLIEIKGIGQWTVDMFMIFHMHAQDVFPIGDLGLVNAIKRKYNINSKEKRVLIKKVNKVGEKWKPYRTVATWYLWRSLDPVAVEY